MPIIAEFCQSHNGSTDTLREMVYHAAESGAQFAKIQSFFADDLTEEWKTDYERLKPLELSWADHKNFVQWCKADGIIPMTSVYTTRYAQEVYNAGFKYVKIGSAQASNEKLIKTYIMAGFKVIVSTGGHRIQDISKTGPIAGVLHCVSKYPFPPEEADLIRMLELKKYFHNVPIGYSDHSDPMHAQWDMASKVAIYLGAQYVERHFTILARNETKDGPVSINPEQLRELCRWDHLKQEQRLVELPSLGLLSCPKSIPEYDLIKKYNKRWKA